METYKINLLYLILNNLSKILAFLPSTGQKTNNFFNPPSGDDTKLTATFIFENILGGVKGSRICTFKEGKIVQIYLIHDYFMGVFDS